MRQSNAKHVVSPIVWSKGEYLCSIDGKTHRAGRRRTLRRLSQRLTGITPGVFRPIPGKTRAVVAGRGMNGR